MFFYILFHTFYFVFVYYRFLYQLDFFYFVTAPLNRVTWIHGAIKKLLLLLLLLLSVKDCRYTVPPCKTIKTYGM